MGEDRLPGGVHGPQTLVSEPGIHRASAAEPAAAAQPPAPAALAAALAFSAARRGVGWRRRHHHHQRRRQPVESMCAVCKSPGVCLAECELQCHPPPAAMPGQALHTVMMLSTTGSDCSLMLRHLCSAQAAG